MDHAATQPAEPRHTAAPYVTPSRPWHGIHRLRCECGTPMHFVGQLADGTRVWHCSDCDPGPAGEMDFQE